MRTSLNNIKLIDDYLLGNMPTADALLFEANILLNAELAGGVSLQKQTHDIIKEYGRQSIRAEIAAVQYKLNTEAKHSRFMQHIANIFKKY